MENSPQNINGYADIFYSVHPSKNVSYDNQDAATP